MVELTVALKSPGSVFDMESTIGWIHTAPKGVKISFLQGFFESAGEIDFPTMSLWAPVLPWIVDDIHKLLVELKVEHAVIGADPPTLAVDLHEIKRIPLLSPIPKDGKYYEVMALLPERVNSKRSDASIYGR